LKEDDRWRTEGRVLSVPDDVIARDDVEKAGSFADDKAETVLHVAICPPRVHANDIAAQIVGQHVAGAGLRYDLAARQLENQEKHK